MKKTTEYGLITGIYFRKLLRTIINIGHFNDENLIVLDFGAGFGELKKMLMSLNAPVKVINYEIKKELTEIENWQDVDFEVIVCNEVFYTFEEEELIQLLYDLKNHNSNLEMIVGISRQSFINKIGAIILNVKDAHKGTKLGPKKELEILLKELEIIEQKSIFYLADVYRLKFK